MRIQSLLQNKITKISNQAEVLNYAYSQFVFIVHPKVFSPIEFVSTKFCLDHLPQMVVNKTFLEIGSGTGIISLLIGLGSANPESNLATDISTFAVTNTQANFNKYNLETEVRLSDLFDKISDLEKFDIIFWNHPFLQHFENTSNQTQNSSQLIADLNYENLSRFFRKSKKHLNTEGSIILCTSKTIGNWSKILKIAIKYGFSKEPCILAKNEDLKYLNQDSFFDLCLIRFDL